MVPANRPIGPTLIIWCTTGVSASRAPASAATLGDQTPQQITTLSVAISPLEVTTPGHPVAVGVDVKHLGTGQDGQRAGGLRLLAHQRPGPQRVDHADRGEVAAAEDHRRVQVGDQLLDAFRGEVLGRDAPGLGLRGAAAQLLHPLRRAGHLDAAGLGEHAERLVLLGGVPGQLEHQPRVLDREDEVGRVPGGAARVGQRPLVHQDEVPPAEQGQVVNQAVADDARADDYGARARRNVTHGLLQVVPRGRSSRCSGESSWNNGRNSSPSRSRVGRARCRVSGGAHLARALSSTVSRVMPLLSHGQAVGDWRCDHRNTKRVARAASSPLGRCRFA